jgi:hypothetical protein
MKTVKIDSTLQGDNLSFLNDNVEVYDFYLDSEGATLQEAKESHILIKLVVDAWEDNLLASNEVEEVLSNYV